MSWSPWWEGMATGQEKAQNSMSAFTVLPLTHGLSLWESQVTCKSQGSPVKGRGGTCVGRCKFTRLQAGQLS